MATPREFESRILRHTDLQEHRRVAATKWHLETDHEGRQYLEDPSQLDKLAELLRNGKSQPRPRGWLFGRGWPQLPTFRTVTEALAVADDR